MLLCYLLPHYVSPLFSDSWGTCICLIAFSSARASALNFSSRYRYNSAYDISKELLTIAFQMLYKRKGREKKWNTVKDFVLSFFFFIPIMVSLLFPGKVFSKTVCGFHSLRMNYSRAECDVSWQIAPCLPTFLNDLLSDDEHVISSCGISEVCDSVSEAQWISCFWSIGEQKYQRIYTRIISKRES